MCFDPLTNPSQTAGGAWEQVMGKPLGVPSQDIARPASIILSMSAEERREQRRYETARDVFAGQSTRQELGTPEGEAQFAVRWADALLAELDKPQK